MINADAYRAVVLRGHQYLKTLCSDIFQTPLICVDHTETDTQFVGCPAKFDDVEPLCSSARM